MQTRGWNKKQEQSQKQTGVAMAEDQGGVGIVPGVQVWSVLRLELRKVIVIMSLFPGRAKTQRSNCCCRLAVRVRSMWMLGSGHLSC